MRDVNGLTNRYSWRQPLLHVAGVLTGLCAFVGIFFAYLDRHQTHAAGTYLPLAVGVGIFFVAMCTLAYLVGASGSSRQRIVRAAVIALLETIIFFNLLMFLMVNTFGE
jgi:hypothetical protein